MNNECKFSTCRRWRYSLIHRLDELAPNSRLLPWIGLNPSTADETKLDPTLRRVKAFSQAAGYSGFVMLNLFAFRATDPKEMLHAMDPVGRENDAVLTSWVRPGEPIVCAWGKHGGHITRWRKVADMLTGAGAKLICVGVNKDGSPKHPLYVGGDTPFTPWTCPKE